MNAQTQLSRGLKIRMNTVSRAIPSFGAIFTNQSTPCRYPLYLIYRRVAQRTLMWYSRKKLHSTHRLQKAPPITRDPTEATMRLLSEYRRIVSERGFDSAAAANFKAAHAEDDDFVRKASIYDRVVFRGQQSKDAQDTERGRGK